jgi:hypothetical protein
MVVSITLEVAAELTVDILADLTLESAAGEALEVGEGDVLIENVDTLELVRGSNSEYVGSIEYDSSDPARPMKRIKYGCKPPEADGEFIQHTSFREGTVDPIAHDGVMSASQEAGDVHFSAVIDLETESSDMTYAFGSGTYKSILRKGGYPSAALGSPP